MNVTTIEFEELKKYIESRFVFDTRPEVEEITCVKVKDNHIEVKWKQKGVGVDSRE